MGRSSRAMRVTILVAAAGATSGVVACGLDAFGEASPADVPFDSGAPASHGVLVDGGPAPPIGEADAPGDTDALPDVAPPELAWYKLDETSGNTAHDSTPNHYDVQLRNVNWNAGATFTLPTELGDSNGGSTTVSAGLREAPVTFTAWLTPTTRTDESSNSYAITPFPPNAVSGDAPGAFGFGVGLDVWTDGTPGSALAVENVGYSFTNADGGAFVSGTEYFVVAAIGASTASTYVDGRLVATSPVTTPGATLTTTLWLGVHNDDLTYGTKRFLAGRMRDVRVYKRLLAPDDVDALYATGPAQ